MALFHKHVFNDVCKRQSKRGLFSSLYLLYLSSEGPMKPEKSVDDVDTSCTLRPFKIFFDFQVEGH